MSDNAVPTAAAVAACLIGAARRSAPAPRSPPAPATSRPAPAPTGSAAAPAAAGDNAAPGKPVTIGFSAPAADHGWIAAIAKNAQAQAEQYSGRHVRAGRTRPTTSPSRSPPSRR